ncbi:MAG: neutral/alkaline non-lysosomal ceramidase N-terminal domain-containing protein [Natrialbaceae archaeon]|nr:neutral/alkaline non-lysosomal ceramidase N-terminal domain-containing protein [Natrialbaceae archaeon]
MSGTEELTAGVARRDITPETGHGFQGYVRPDMRAEGVGIRLFARALVLDDGDSKLALVSADLLFGAQKDAVVERVRDRGFTADSIFYLGTHTHAATEAGEWTGAQVAEAIAAADENRQPAHAGWATAEVPDVNRSRSIEAHLANHGQDIYPGTGEPSLDPRGPDHPRETTVRLLRVDTTDGEPLAAWTQFAVHPTAYTPHNTVYSADLAGAALRHFTDSVEGSPVALFGNETEGDLIPRYEAYNQYALADRLGARLADGMGEAWDRAGESLSPNCPVAGRETTIHYEGQEVEPGKRVGSRAWFGLPFLGGGENGPSFFFGLGLEGKRRPARLAGKVHGRKLPVMPAPWSPDVRVQVVRVGDHLLLGVPGEPTVEMGRQTTEAVAEVAPEWADSIAVCGLANEYNGYFTTPAEYDQQHYEGGHTVFGKYQSLLLRDGFIDLVAKLDQAPAPPATDSGRPRQFVDPPVGHASSGSLRRSPQGQSSEWKRSNSSGGVAPRAGTDPVGDPFVHVERATDEGWDTVDTDLDLGLLWTVDGCDYRARYEVPRDAPTGEYRLRVTGTGYTLESPTFEVTPSTGLRIRGAEVDGERIVIRAQNPPPDPDTHLRPRPRSPRGGSVTLEDGTTADWDADAEGWVLPADERTSISIPAGGLEDGLGNTAETSATIETGALEPVDWPAHIGPGGGRPPGPFGIGTWPI